MSRLGRIATKLLASELYHVSRSIRAVVGGERNEFSQVIDKLRYVSEKYKIPIAVVGGLAGNYFGSIRPTDDIDISVSSAQVSEFLDWCRYEGFKVREVKSGWHVLRYSGIEVDIIPEGGKARDDSPTTIPGPAALGVSKGLDYACFQGWVELKLSSGRSQDRTAVIELLKKAQSGEIAKCQEHLAKVHSNYLSQFNQLYQEAQNEWEQESKRGGSRLW